MSTSYDKVRGYYAAFNEWARLDSPEGTLELRRTLEVVEGYLASWSCGNDSLRVLDLGGGSGRYAIELARRGYQVVLADIAPELLAVARERCAELSLEPGIESFDEVNATDLSRYEDGAFDSVLALGPFYHMIAEAEREQAVREIHRVLRPGGIVFVSFIPRVSGIVGLIERAAACPDQVTAETLRAAADTGVFHNASHIGFQEGFYPLPEEIEQLFAVSGFDVIDMLSVRSIENGLAEQVQQLEASLRAEVEALVESMSRRPEIIATAGHALLILKRT